MKKAIALLALLTLSLAACSNADSDHGNPPSIAAKPALKSWESPHDLVGVWVDESGIRDFIAMVTRNAGFSFLYFYGNETGYYKKVLYDSKKNECYRKKFDFAWTADAATIILSVTKVYWSYGCSGGPEYQSTATDKINEIAGSETFALDYTISSDGYVLEIPAWEESYDKCDSTQLN